MTDDCEHADFTTENLPGGRVRFTCLDCGTTSTIYREDPS